MCKRSAIFVPTLWAHTVATRCSIPPQIALNNRMSTCVFAPCVGYVTLPIGSRQFAIRVQCGPCILCFDHCHGAFHDITFLSASRLMMRVVLVIAWRVDSLVVAPCGRCWRRRSTCATLPNLSQFAGPILIASRASVATPSQCVCVCVAVCVRACVRACVHVWVDDGLV